MDVDMEPKSSEVKESSDRPSPTRTPSEREHELISKLYAASLSHEIQKHLIAFEEKVNSVVEKRAATAQQIMKLIEEYNTKLSEDKKCLATMQAVLRKKKSALAETGISTESFAEPAQMLHVMRAEPFYFKE